MSEQDKPFPLSQQSVYPWQDHGVPMEAGLTKREYFVGQALIGILSHPHSVGVPFDNLIQRAINFADQLIAKLEGDDASKQQI